MGRITLRQASLDRFPTDPRRAAVLGELHARPFPLIELPRALVVLAWVTQGAGVAELSDHAGTRVGFDWTIREFLERQWMFARRLLPTWYLVLALPALVAGLADARSRFLTAILASMVVAFAVVPADNAWVHDYWNFPALMALFPGFAALAERAGSAVVRLRGGTAGGSVAGLRRGLAEGSVAVLLVAAPLVVPLLVVAAVYVRVVAGGGVLFRQVRTGRDGVPFTLAKFRTMRHGAEADGAARLAAVDDDRVVRGCRWMRRTRLDELPQVWHVVRGEMSLVGPRPERPELISEFEAAIPGYGRRHEIAPGITGLAQVRAGYHTDPAYKLGHDLQYLMSWSPVLDLQILARTVLVLFRPGS